MSRPLLSPSDAVAALIKAACDWADEEEVAATLDAADALEEAVDDYRRSQRENP